MGTSLESTPAASAGPVEQYDAIIIGAGISGLYQLFVCASSDSRCGSYEDGSGVGGTWYWNRYPGCRFDSESETYGYSFSEGTSAGMGLEGALSPASPRTSAISIMWRTNSICAATSSSIRDVTAAIYDEKANRWEVRIEDGTRVTHAIPDRGGRYPFGPLHTRL